MIRKMKFGDIIVTGAIIGVILLIIIPLSPFFLDLFLILNISISVVIFLTTMYIKEPLEFSIFPSLLLIITLFRLALNIASTRLILGNGGEAGSVIKTFGSFVIQGNMVVGFIIFLIIMIIQFLVITKGAERVAEVSARFTLDAMPGKQMAIDADLSSGLIDEYQARERRLKVQHGAEFYGGMDGASKFVKGDAIVSIIIIIINSIGGIIIGMMGPNALSFGQIIEKYTLATIGDGLSSQIPALFVSTATGIIVTRNASSSNMAADLSKQLTAQPIVLMLAGGTLLVINFIPGLPHVPIFVLSGLFIYLGYMLYRSHNEKELVAAEEPLTPPSETDKAQNILNLLQVDPIELEFGYSIIPLADVGQGGDLLDRVVMIRRQCALDMGMVIPVVRLRDNIQLNPGEYAVKIKGVEVARGEIMSDHYLAMNPGGGVEGIDGVQTVEPTFGLPAKWIREELRDRAEILGYTVVDPVSVIATHLTEILKKYSYELLGRQDVQTLIEQIKKNAPALVEEVTPKLLTLGEVQKVLINLLRENIPIRDMATILEILGDYGGITRDPDMLTEYVRQGLKRTITRSFVQKGNINVITIDPDMEDIITKGIQHTQHGSYLSLDPEQARSILDTCSKEILRVSSKGYEPVILTSPVVRIHFKKFMEQAIPDLVVLSYNEIEQSVQIQAVGVVKVRNAS
ncbi:MAG: flagellar biosynthesis protein FlhA [Firmicutes bacterium]|nr:flagellar biosynthesis protein FlhA [Bacillota bacterium]